MWQLFNDLASQLTHSNTHTINQNPSFEMTVEDVEDRADSLRQTMCDTVNAQRIYDIFPSWMSQDL